MKHPPLFSRLLRAAAGMLAACAIEAGAQTLVYQMEFKKAPHSINFELFDRAYFVVNGLGGEGSFVFTYREDGRDYYLTSAGGGLLFFAVESGKSSAVVRATADNASGQSHYLATGQLDGRVSANLRGQRVTLGVAETLTGWVVSSDPEDAVSYTGPSSTLGVAGFATLKATLDNRRTQDANTANLDVGQTVAAVIEQLERDGYESGEPAAEPEPEPAGGVAEPAAP